MSLASAIARANEIRDRLGMPSQVRTVGNQGFDQVLANAQNHFDLGPAKVTTMSQSVTPGGWGDNANYVPASGTAAGGSPSADIGTAGFATPAKVNGWSPQVSAMMDAASKKFGVPKELLTAVSRAESAFRSEVTSPAGAVGMMQLMPATAKGLGVTNATDPWQNIAGGAKYLRQLLDRFHGDATKAVAGYNAGPNAVQKYGGVPPYKETQTYVARVSGYAAELGFQL
ncbi:MAG: yjbJ [Thermoleophilia bacterium]|nr:yjbJ [Thermoleophilia bacterium]